MANALLRQCGPFGGTREVHPFEMAARVKFVQLGGTRQYIPTVNGLTRCTISHAVRWIAPRGDFRKSERHSDPTQQRTGIHGAIAMLTSVRTSTCGMLRASALCGSRLRAASGRLIHPAVRRMSVPAHHNYSETFGDHSWRQQNHIWNEAEIAERMATADQKHVPQGLAEHVLQKMVRVSYHAFNAITGYEHADPATSAIGYRCEDGRPAVYARPLI